MASSTLFISIIHHGKISGSLNSTFRQVPEYLIFSLKFSCRNFTTSSSKFKRAALTPQEVDKVLRVNEYSHAFSSPGPVKSYDSNQLPSNNPMEDARAEAKCLISNKLLLGVFDGHGGAACAQVVAKRIFNYLNAALLPKEALENYLDRLKFDKVNILENYNEKYYFTNDLMDIYENSFTEYLKELSDSEENPNVKESFKNSFCRLDKDLLKEAEKGGIPLTVALSGCVACVVQIDERDLHVASVGDCQVVLGSLSDSNSWVAKKLSIEHNDDNASEVRRILSEHPDSESAKIITNGGRLLGQLAPFRAFGDVRYKWSRELMNKFLVPQFGSHAMPDHYLTPPYLTARPDVTHHRLNTKDKFLVIASDGLWDLLSPLEAVRLVGEYMRGRVALTPFRPPRYNMKLGEVSLMLDARSEGLTNVPVDSNSATHLMRHALGGTEVGVKHSELSWLLSMPQDLVRIYRDDITVTVVYFDSDYLRLCPT